MRKLKLYLDTSVISHLQHEDTPERMNETLALWEEIKQGKFFAVTSDIAMREIGGCKEPKRSKLLDYLSEIEYERLPVTKEAEELAAQIVDMGILTKKSFEDCLHIAIAVTTFCDIIVSWNFSHMVNVRTINGVRAVNILNGYKTIDIYSPSVLLKGDDFNG